MGAAEGTFRRTVAEMIFGRAGTAQQPPAQAHAAVPAMSLGVGEAANIFKALGHEGRLTILCYLADGERSVTELERILDSRQSAVSQQLARLRMERLVTGRREGKAIYYSLSDPRLAELLTCFGRIYAAGGTPGR